VVSAQSPLYGQCGGQGWTGPTTCVAGAVCVYENEFHYQCLPATTTTATTTTPSVEPTAPPGSLSVKTSCVNTTLQQEWFIGWCLTGKRDKYIQSSVYLGNKIENSNGYLTWGTTADYNIYCNSCTLSDTSELSCICPTGGEPLFTTTINLEEHIANYNGYLLNDLSGPPIVPTHSKPNLFPSDVSWAYDPGDTYCFNTTDPATCAFETYGPGCDGVASSRYIVPTCYYDVFTTSTGSSARDFKSMAFYATDGAYVFEIWDNLACSGWPSATITAAEYAQCVPLHKRLVAWAAVPQWNADL